MGSRKIPGIVVLFLVIMGLLMVNACMILSAAQTRTPSVGSGKETGTATPQEINPENGTSAPEQTLEPASATTLPGNTTPIPGGEPSNPPDITSTQINGTSIPRDNITLIPLQMTETAFSILVHGSGSKSRTPSLMSSISPYPISGSRTITLTPTRSPIPTNTPYRTMTHSVSWYWTSTPSFTPTRGAGTLTAIKEVTYIYATRTGRAATHTAAAKTSIANFTRTAMFATTQAALSTGTRTVQAATFQEQTVNAQIRTIEAHATETSVAIIAVDRVTETAQYRSTETAVIGTIQPTYVLTPAPAPTLSINHKIAYSDSYSGSSSKRVILIRSLTSIEGWVFLSNVYDATLCDVSPDGRKVIFEMNNKLYIAYPKETAIHVDLLPKQDVLPDDQNSQAAFSSDGEWIAFRKVSNGNTDLWMIRWSGSNLTQLTDNIEDEQDPAWSPDGSRVVMSRGGNLYTLDVSVKPPLSVPTPVLLLSGSSNTYIHPHYQPGGTKMVYEQSGSPSYIFLATISSNSLTTITSWTGSMPNWSSDGLKVIYVNNSDIYQIDSSGSPDGTLVFDTINARNPVWVK